MLIQSAEYVECNSVKLVHMAPSFSAFEDLACSEFFDILHSDPSSQRSDRASSQDEDECNSVPLAHMPPGLPETDDCSVSNLEQILPPACSVAHEAGVATGSSTLLEAHDEQISSDGEQQEDARNTGERMSAILERLDVLQCQLRRL